MEGFDNGFSSSVNSGLKTFANFSQETNNQSTFNNNLQNESNPTNQQQSGVNMFQTLQGSFFGNQSNQAASSLFSQQNNGNLFGSSQQTSNLIAPSNNFGANKFTQQNQPTGTNFLTNYNPNSGSSSSTRPAVNPSMLQPRK